MPLSTPSGAAVIAAILTAVVGSHSVAADPSPAPLVAFKPPFNAFDEAGARLVSNFTWGGTTQVNENFIRLTPNFPSKWGWLWSKGPMDADQWTALLRFRVSGPEKAMFGEGFVLWFSQDKVVHPGVGPHGIPDSFTGFGIVFDTFRHSQSDGVHLDVSVVARHGKETTVGAHTPMGCDGNFRFWEGRNDFTVNSKSVARVTLNRDRLTIAMDSKNSGDFITCIDAVELHLPTDWQRTAFIGLTSSTGNLADYHDILSLEILPGIVSQTTAEDEFQGTGNAELDAAIKAAVVAAAKPLSDKLTHLHHHLEHQLSSIQSTLQSNLKKVAEQEEHSTRRLEEVTGRLNQRLSDSLPNEVGASLDASLQQRLQAIEEIMVENLNYKVAEQVDPVLNSVSARAEKAKGGWVLPFVGLVAVVCALAGIGYRNYRSVLKTHLL